ncbi:hypothetical protein LTR84_001537 [Exophiala bonariae]|uniref:Uncharacterized protein n=1 Tax=Exophiala bonariae TaxID=1690606 RepID=A0AAV9NF40_9EURO|nr:hypothetical protein LTR84_001537 [Exophiala bonariae]
MPSKYSHSVVLANYSSQGIIAFPANQQSDGIAGAHRTPQSDKPKSVTGYVPRSISSPRERPATVASNYTDRSSSRQNALNENTQARPLSQGRRSRVQTRTPTADTVNGQLQKDDASNHDQPPNQNSAKGNRSSGARLTSPYDPSPHHPRPVHAGEPPLSSNKPGQVRNGIQPQKRTTAYAAQTVQPRSGTVLPAGTRPPAVSLKRTASRASPNSHSEALLSLQQFLDSSARLTKIADVPKPRAQTPNQRSPPKQLLASPELSSEVVKPTSAGRKNGTSFIDSSDEDDHVDNTPGTSVRSAKTVPKPIPKARPPTKQITQHFEKDSASEGKKRLDLTKSPPPSPVRDGSSVDELQPPPKSPLRAFRAVHKHTRQASDDFDDPFGPLPLQKHSPLQRTSSNDKRRSLGLPYPSQRDANAGPSLFYGRPSSKSAESLPLQARNKGSELHFSNLAGSGDDDREHEVDTQSMSHIHVHRRYYRTVDNDIPNDESRPNIITANSWNARRAAARTPTPVPWQSPAREAAVEEFMTQQDEEEPGEFSEPEPNILTNATLHVSRSPAPQIPSFGVPSIVRSPEVSPAAQKQQYQHVGGRETGTKSPRMPGPRSLQRHKQSRSQHPPLSRIIEARPQDESSAPPAWKLPTVQASEPGVFGAEIFMRLSSEYDTGTESEMERTSDGATFAASHRRNQDNFTTDFTTIPIEEVVTPGTDLRSPAKSVPRSTTGKRNLGSATSLPTTRAEVTRPRTRQGLADLQDDDLFDDDDEEDYEHISADAPPDITRHRRVRVDSGTDQDGLQSLIHALRAGPSLKLASPARTAAKQQLTSIDRFEEMIRRADEAETRRRQSKNKVGAVFGRFLRR